MEEVNLELDSVAIEAQREEQRLLEKVEQEHRDAQRHLSQVRRENAAAARVVQSLVDQQLRKIVQLKEQIQRWSSTASVSNKNQIQRGVAEVTLPWEISLTMKRVSFQICSRSKNLSFGEIDVREQSMTYPVGVCGVEGQKCALHSGDEAFSNITPKEIRKEPQPNRPGHRYSPKESNKANSGNTRVIRKLHLSSSTEIQDNPKSPRLKAPVPRHRGVSESSEGEEVDSTYSETPGQDIIPPVSIQGKYGDDEYEDSETGTKRHSTLKGKMDQKTAVLVSCVEPVCPPEETDATSNFAITSPKTRAKGSLSRHSLGDLFTRHHLLSRHTLPKRNTSNESLMDGSLCYTYTVNAPVNESLKQQHCRSMSTTELSGKLCSLINNDLDESRGIRKVSRMSLASKPIALEQSNVTESGGNKLSTYERQSRSQICCRQDLSLNRVSRSLSMSAIDGDKLHQGKEPQQYNKDKKEKVLPDFGQMAEEDGLTALDSAFLVKQFGKQGSGRSDFNLPSGIHATVKGQLFVVDCGNARIQVTDLQRNVVQQVSPTGSESSSRICNYFDVAVNSKGLIALTCAAERAVLVFNRHGRLLQTFGGTSMCSTTEQLDAPRGLTVIREEEFLVADIKRGTLTSLKLDPRTGARLERTVVTGYHRPYLVAACLTTGLMAVSERGNETGRVPCIRVLDPGWNTIRILGVCSSLGPVLACPWGLCIDNDGDVLVADWGKQHYRVLLYPPKGVGWPIVNDSLRNPRGLALLPNGHMVVSDSMNHCIKIYRYK
ncbi:uncharacterized protein AB9W97_008279 [Spinachia spinachia]